MLHFSVTYNHVLRVYIFFCHYDVLVFMLYSKERGEQIIHLRFDRILNYISILTQGQSYLRENDLVEKYIFHPCEFFFPCEFLTVNCAIDIYIILILLCNGLWKLRNQ